MKMKCTEGTELGALVDCNLDFPGDEELDAGCEPTFVVDSMDLAVAEFQDGYEVAYGKANDPSDSAYILSVSVMQLLTEACDGCDGHGSNAEIIVGWLEHWASQLREKYGIH